MLSPIEKLANLLEHSRKTVVLTGAGVSTESGIPDFRSPGGLWSKVDPMYVFSAETFTQRPQVFYEVGLPHLGAIASASPNQTHYVLAALEGAGLLAGVITQNVDGLHQKAGSSKVYELHGHFRTATCMDCGTKIGWDHLVELVMNSQIPPRCGDCRGVYKPDAVFFGDQLPRDFEESVQEARDSDLMLVIGSSLEVQPANFLPSLSKQVAIINLGATMADRRSAIKISAGAGDTLVSLWDELAARGMLQGFWK